LKDEGLGNNAEELNS